MIIFNNIDILWYHYVIAGFCFGLYMHSYRFHHAIHWMFVKVLSGFIFLLQKTDPLYQEPEKVKTKPPVKQVVTSVEDKEDMPRQPSFSGNKDKPRLTPDDLEILLRRNSNLSVSRKPR